MKDPRKIENRRVKNSYISVIASTSVVLFMLGTIGLLILSSQKLSEYLKENFTVRITLKNTLKPTEQKQLEKSLQVAEYTKSVEFISKEQALDNLKQDLGEGFIDFIGENPLSDKFEIKLIAKYANNAKIDSISNVLTKLEYVENVEYNKLLIKELNENIKKISLWIGVFSLGFFIIFIILINNSIRLMIYSKRFTIKTMQLVGATRSFIAKPFIFVYLRNGFIASMIAISAFSLFIYYLWEIQPELKSVIDINTICTLFAMIIIVALIISFISTKLALAKFLSKNIEELYYQ